MGLRVHRSISWIGRPEQATDDDGRFIFLWIAFDAAYADNESLVAPFDQLHEGLDVTCAKLQISNSGLPGRSRVAR